MKSIILNTDDARAILDGRKTVARKVVKPQPPEWIEKLSGPEMYTPGIIDKYGDLQEGNPIYGVYDDDGDYGVKCPYNHGDILWVRETWRVCQCGIYCYKAIGDCDTCCTTGENTFDVKWRPSVHMPREAARIFLRVTDVRVERLQDITVEDVIAEGIDADNDIRNPDPKTHESIKNWNLQYAQFQYKGLWDSLNAKRGHGWDSNPWVWVISFEKAEEPV